MAFKKVFIVGVGQIGASVGLAIREKRLAREVVGLGRRRKNLALARRRGAVSVAIRLRSPADLRRIPFEREDLVVLATPVATIRRCLRFLSPIPLVIDVGSTKERIVQEAWRRRLRFVGTHPIAGTEKDGAGAGDADLFKGRLCLITPTGRTDRRDLGRVGALWRAVGAQVERISPARHDRLLSSISHLPHALAYSLTAAVAAQVGGRAMARYPLAGLRDTTRVAASPPSMWAEIFLENRRNVLRGLRFFDRELGRLERMIRTNDRERLLEWLRRAQRVRLRF